MNEREAAGLEAKVRRYALEVKALEAQNEALRKRKEAARAEAIGHVPLSIYRKMEEEILQRNLEADRANERIKELEASLAVYRAGTAVDA